MDLETPIHVLMFSVSEGITIGSDAHTPETLGIGFDYCREMLKEYGFRYYTVFHERKAEMLPL